MSIQRFQSMTSILSHLALWPTLYTLGVYTLSAQALDLNLPTPITIIVLLSIGHSCYLLDRVKINDSRQDPADAIALPDRALLFARHAKKLRVLCVLECAFATFLSLFISPMLSCIPLAALIGVHLYAGRAANQSQPRLKDLPALKSFFISSAHCALVLSLMISNNELNTDRVPFMTTLLVLFGIWSLVSGDAIICDLDDHSSDLIYNTKSLPVLAGLKGAWMCAQCLIWIGLILLAIFSLGSTLSFIGLISIGVIAGFTLNHKNRRDLIDARLLPCCLIGFI